MYAPKSGTGVEMDIQHCLDIRLESQVFQCSQTLMRQSQIIWTWQWRWVGMTICGPRGGEETLLIKNEDREDIRLK